MLWYILASAQPTSGGPLRRYLPNCASSRDFLSSLLGRASIGLSLWLRRSPHVVTKARLACGRGIL